MSACSRTHRLYFFLDFISHSTWLAWNRMPALAAKYDLTLEPVLFAGLLGAWFKVGPSVLRKR